MNCERLDRVHRPLSLLSLEQWNNNCKTTPDILRSFEDLQKQRARLAARSGCRKHLKQIPAGLESIGPVIRVGLESHGTDRERNGRDPQLLVPQERLLHGRVMTLLWC